MTIGGFLNVKNHKIKQNGSALSVSLGRRDAIR